MNKILYAVLLFTFYLYPQSPAGYYNNAMEAYKAAHYPEAVRIFEKFLQSFETEDETYASANFYIAESHFNLKQNLAAIPYFEFLVNNNEWTNYRELSLFRLGIIYFEETDYTQSRERFKRLLSLYPGNEFTGTALYWIGQSYIREGRTADALKFLEEAVENKSNNTHIDNTLFSLASAYEKTGDYENAVKYYDRLLSYHRDSPLAVQAQIRIGICYFKLKDYESSILELNNPMLSNLSEDLYSESLYLLANSYFKTGSYEEAEKIYREIEEKYPSSEVIREVKYGHAWSLFQQKQYDAAFTIFDLLSEGEDSISEKSFLWKAEAKRYSGNETEAFDLYKEFLEKYPNSSYTGHIHYQMGVIYFDDKKPDISERYLNSALKSDDQFVRSKAYVLKGEIDLNKKNFRSAKENFEKAAEIPVEDNELNARAYLGLGTALYYLKNYKEAINYLNKVSADMPQFETNKVNFYLAENLYASGNYQEAINRYNLITEEDRKLFSSAMFGKAYSNFHSGKYDQAAALFSDFIKKFPGDTNVDDARIRLADSYYGSKNYAAASSIYNNIFSDASMLPDNPHIYFQYAQALYRGGKTEEAILKFQEVKERFPQSDYAPRAYYIIGWIYFQKGEYSRAISQYLSTLELYPGGQIAPVTYYSIGDAYYNMERYDSAIVNYEKIITLFPSSTQVYDALNGIQYSYIALNQPEKAIDKIEQYLSEHPSSSFADQLSYKRGEIFYSNKSYERAIESYKSFLNNYRNSKLVPDAYFWIGKSAQNLGRSEEAVYNFNMVIDNFPGTELGSSAVIEVTTIYNQMRRHDMSLKLLDKVIDRTNNESPVKSELLYLKGVTLAQKGDIAGAADVFSELSMYYKTSIFGDKAKFELGLLDLRSQSYTSAERNFKELSETRTDDLGAKAQFYYGEALFQQKKMNEAITAFVRVRSVFSSYGEWLTRSYLRLGDCYVEIGEPDKAADMYRAVLSRNRGDVYGEEAQKKLRAIQ